MIITKEEFFEMGFTADDNALLERCIKRAEFVLNGLTGNRASVIALGNGAAADLVKQAAAFQTDSLLKEERTANAVGGGKTTERVAIGDFSYTSSNSDESIQPLDRDKTVIKLLRAAGCLYSGTEVLE